MLLNTADSVCCEVFPLYYIDALFKKNHQDVQYSRLLRIYIRLCYTYVVLRC